MSCISLLSTVTMANSIRLFQFVQKFHRAIGINPSHSHRNHTSINFRSTIFQICATPYLFSSFAFLVLDATSLFDYGSGFFGFSTMFNILTIYLLFMRQSENTFKFIESCETFIATSKYYSGWFIIKSNAAYRFVIELRGNILFTGTHSVAIYRQIAGKIERFTKGFSGFICAELIFCIFAPMPYSIVRYYIYDMGAKSFYLFFPTWFVIFTIKLVVLIHHRIRWKCPRTISLWMNQVAIRLENSIGIFGGI